MNARVTARIRAAVYPPRIRVPRYRESGVPERRGTQTAGGGARVARRGAEQPHQAGASLRTQYEDSRRVWAGRRRRSVWLSALWWGPAAVLFGLLAGVGTKYALFGLLVTALVIAAVIDVGFRHPESLDRLKDRADAEAGTARE